MTDEKVHLVEPLETRADEIRRLLSLGSHPSDGPNFVKGQGEITLGQARLWSINRLAIAEKDWSDAHQEMVEAEEVRQTAQNAFMSKQAAFRRKEAELRICQQDLAIRAGITANVILKSGFEIKEVKPDPELEMDDA